MTQINTGDTAWVILSSALVMFMVPGLAFFYGGMVRKKNVLSMVMLSFIAMAVIGVEWVLYGYSLAFGPDQGGLIGGLNWAGLKGLGMNPDATYAGSIPVLAFVSFQGMFAAITPALMTGAIAERIKLGSYILLVLLWATLIYNVAAHWVWGAGGWLHNLGALDFAGGLVVHVLSGVSALALVSIIGPRRGFGEEPMEPHNIPMTVLGAGILWFGWFGFNGGSALSANGLAAHAILITHIAASSAALTWLILNWLHDGRVSALGLATGAVAGLVGITPAAGYVSPLAAIAIGASTSVVSYFAVLMKMRKGFDDSLDVWGVHGVGGIWGSIATGIFATTSVNPAGADGLLFGNVHQFLVQLLSVIAVAAFAYAGTWVLAKIIDVTVGLRVERHEEYIGLDLAQHGEKGYV